MVDRHHRSMSPLLHQGLLFACGNEHLYCVDAYNGTVRWEADVPGSLRLGIMHDAGNVCVAGDDVCIASNSECQVLCAATGERARRLHAPQLVEGEARHWGYLAAIDRQVFGSGMKPTATFRTFGFGNSSIGRIEGDFRLKAMSEYLFSLDRHKGRVLWTYAGGAMLNSAIAIGNGRVYLVESRDEGVIGNEVGRISARDFCARGNHLVALSSKHGAMVWQRPIRLLLEHIIFVSYAKGLVIVSGSRNVDKKVQYELYAFDAATGKTVWHNHCQPGHGIGGTHGEQWQHPAIVDDTIYLMPFAFDLATGRQRGDWRFARGGHGCGTITASAGQLFFRGGNPQMLNLATDQLVPINRVTRPGCWVHIIPAGGLVLIPESSSGCTCGFPLQTSSAYIPEAEPDAPRR
jgi:outer membrane protein assembly factor BamB